jgi:hypothetical protein
LKEEKEYDDDLFADLVAYLGLRIAGLWGHSAGLQGLRSSGVDCPDEHVGVGPGRSVGDLPRVRC